MLGRSGIQGILGATWEVPIMHKRFLVLPLLCAVMASPAAGKRAGFYVNVRPTYNVTPSATWQMGKAVTLAIDARRDPRPGHEDIFFSQQFAGTFPRTAGQTFNVQIPDVRPGERIIVRGYMCAEGTTDCIPSDRDNPPGCGFLIQIHGNSEPSCQPIFTWTGGSAGGGVSCTAGCARK